MDDRAIDTFVARSRELDGQTIAERAAWNTTATADAIRHFAYGTSDDNPMWVNREYARSTPHGVLLAPPAFLCSVLYPFLHGASVPVPLSSLIGRVSMEWHRLIREGDELRASARQTGVTDTFDRRGRRLVLIDAETRYWNQHGDLVGVAHGTMARIARDDGDMFLTREISRYGDVERDALRDALGHETRRGAAGRHAGEAWIGQPLPVLVRGPLSVGDLICWQAAIGPSYRAGSLGYRDMLAAPHHVAVNPVTGWPVKYSQQHEDFLMAAQRGMPAPFDNSLMRFAWIAPMLTNWMGDSGRLRRLSIQTDAPLLYGDTTWYRGVVTDLRPASDDAVAVSIRISGVNQLGQTTTSGDAEVLLPARAVRPNARTLQPRPLMDRDVLSVVRSQCASRRLAIAAQSGDLRLTYQELDERSTRTAERLLAAGAVPGAPVALELARTLDSLVLVLGAMKAGCAYLPIDPALGAERLLAVLSLARPRLLVAPGPLREPLARARSAAGPACRFITLDELERTAGTRLGDTPAPDDGLAYIMPTSGTTGVPRLVGVSRGSLSRYLHALPDALETGADDVFVHTAAFSFSASVRQLFLPLCTGARLVVADEATRIDLMALLAQIRACKVTVWDTVPSVWSAAIEGLHALSGSDRSALLENSLRLVLTTGEPLAWSTCDRWRRLGHRARVVNLYSQTETAGTVCVFPVRDDADRGGSPLVPLGTPLPGVRVDLLDDRLQPVADGEVGEIGVGGDRLASGYVGEADASAGRFVLRPFCHAGFYRTGDLGFRRADGTLEYVGRRDDCVKIRGQRVALSLVEAALKAMDAIADAAVVADDDEGVARLIAYVVPRGDVALSPGDIREHVRRALSDAAVPSSLVQLAALPRGISGKADREALTAAVRREAPAGEAPAAGDTLAHRIERVFAEALSMRRVAPDDNFFDLGGNSLMATVVLARLRFTLGVQLPMLRFFETPTVSAMTALVEELLLQQVEAMSDDEAGRLLGDDTPL